MEVWKKRLVWLIFIKWPGAMGALEVWKREALGQWRLWGNGGFGLWWLWRSGNECNVMNVMSDNTIILLIAIAVNKAEMCCSIFKLMVFIRLFEQQ